jgi:hypothetical protein
MEFSEPLCEELEMISILFSFLLFGQRSFPAPLGGEKTVLVVNSSFSSF